MLDNLTPVDYKVPSMMVSTTPGPTKSDVVENDEDLLPTGKDIADIDALSFPPEISESEILAA